MTDVLTLREAADYLRLSEEGLRRLALAGAVPARRVGWGYRSIVERHLVPAFGSLSLVSLSRRDVQSWVNRQSGSPQTIRHRLDCLRGAMSRAVRWGLIDSNPAKEIDLPVVAKRQLSAVNHDEVRSLLAAVEGSDIAPLVIVALFTGLRQGELLGLRWEDVNLGSARLPSARDAAERDLRQVRTQDVGD